MLSRLLFPSLLFFVVDLIFFFLQNIGFLYVAGTRIAVSDSSPSGSVTQNSSSSSISCNLKFLRGRTLTQFHHMCSELRWVDVRGEVNMVEGQVNRENTEAKKEMLIRSEGCRDRL